MKNSPNLKRTITKKMPMDDGDAFHHALDEFWLQVCSDLRGSLIQAAVQEMNEEKIVGRAVGNAPRDADG